MRHSRPWLQLAIVATIPWLISCSQPTPQNHAAADGAEEAAAATAPAATDEATVNGYCADQPYVERPGAAQDVYSGPTNFLRCTAGSYALCYYSGANPLPCTLDDGVGNCQCQVFEASSDAPMYVEIGGILNQCIYDETVVQCGEDGKKCQNICVDKPHALGCQDNPPDLPVAKVCNYITDGTFNQDAAFISTFSLATVSVPNREDTFSIGSNSENGQYAGCMTAPCTGRWTDERHLYTTCACPLWPTDGGSAPYQYGRQCIDGETDPLSPGYCTLNDDQVWSAAVSEAITQSAADDVATQP